MLDRLSPRPGAKHSRRRVGRGPGSGIGKTCGTGVKGQGTRSGKKISAWFEGGQMPLVQRVPKRGFHNRFRKAAEIVNLADLSVFGDGVAGSESIELLAYLRRLVAWPEKAAAHRITAVYLAWLGQILVPDDLGSSEGAARITGSRLNPYVLE